MSLKICIEGSVGMYKGMNWLKCDLQMQTPGDSYNWVRDDQCYIDGNSSEEEVYASVDTYLRRCHEVELEIVGITDHNFIGRNYLEKLIERNSVIAKEVDRKPLIIFPGFEIEISQGNGIHFLCLFDPSMPLQEIDDIVTILGLPSTRRVTANKILPASITFDTLLRVVQEEPRHNGIVIAAHPLAESGMLNDRFLSDHFQQYILTDPRLLAIEIPAPLDKLSVGWQKLLKSGGDCHPSWRREHPIATLMSSDCYSLDKTDKGYIGKRYSWIRMSDFTIEGLRQSMRDHDSRIMIQEECPIKNMNYGRIKSLEIKNVAFLEDKEIHFSPNFNCIIGGRGSGKSSILEYIRACTNSFNEDHIQDNYTRLKNTLNNNSELRLTWEDIGGRDVFEYNYTVNKAKVLREEAVVDEDTIFKNLGIQIYSQKQITDIANQTENLLPIIDQICGEKIKSSKKEEDRLKDEIRLIQQEVKRLNRKLKEKLILNQELIELQKQWTSFVTVKDENDRRLKAKDAKDYLERLQGGKAKIISNWSIHLEQFNKSYDASIAKREKWENEDFFKEIEEKVEASKNDLILKVETALKEFSDSINATTIEDYRYKDVIKNIDQANVEFLLTCEREGLKPSELQVLEGVNEKISLKEKELEIINEELGDLKESEEKSRNLFKKLYKVWANQTIERKEKVNSILMSDIIPKNAITKEPFISVEINEMLDKEHFISLWESIKINRTTRLGRNWTDFGTALFTNYEQSTDFNTPWDLLIHYGKNKENILPELEGYFDQLIELLHTDQDWDELMITRVNDEIDITLMREDGSRAGSLLDNGLSDGQKNTAILTLLFADGSSPIIIDQPEDELDSDFIYNQLVPLIRNIKSKRQIIISTHNANLPVNGDADLVYALNTNMGHGVLRQQGGLDQESVREGILDIMEGSEEAFRKRKEKYYS